VTSPVLIKSPVHSPLPTNRGGAPFTGAILLSKNPLTSTAAGVISFSRPSPGDLVDFLGGTQTAAINEARFEGVRRAENILDPDVSLWVRDRGGTGSSAPVMTETDPAEGFRFTFDKALGQRLAVLA